MRISIITVCYNSAATIQDTIDAVSRQTHHDIEHIVIDGGSTDGTVEIIRNAKTIARFVSEEDHGIYDAMNKGISMATGEVIGLLNADDIYAHDSVLSRVAEVFSNEAVDACYADLVYVDQQDMRKVIRYWKSNDYHAGLFEKGWMPAHPTFFLRRCVYEQHGGFDLNFPRQADFELTMRILAVCLINSVYIPDIWVRMRIGGASNCSLISILKGNLEAYRACKKNGLNVNCLFIPRKLMSRIPQFFVRPPSLKGEGN